MNNRGFTLVEVVVAMAVAALVATLAYQALSVSSEASIRSTEAAKNINNIDRFWQLLETDLRHAVSRTGKDNVGLGTLPALQGGEDSDYLLLFVRSGWVNPLKQRRSALLKVGYVLEDDTLWRHYWFMVDNFGEDEARKLDLLTKVTNTTVRFLPNTAKSLDDSQWQDLWPVSGRSDLEVLPAAVEVTIELEGMGEIKRIFPLASG